MTAHVHESPRDVLLKTARDGAAISRRWGDEDRAREWDALAVELGAALHDGCGGQWVSMAVVCGADDPQVCARCGERRVVPVALREDPVVAELHEPSGPPVDGREVDRAPESHRVLCGDDELGVVRLPCDCLIGQDHDEFNHPLTDGRSAVPPTADLPSLHVEKES